MPDALDANARSGQSAGPAAPGGGRLRSRPLLAALALLAAGLALSVGAALRWHAAVRAHERQTFEASAASVAATLTTELRRDAEFMQTLRALVAMRPHISATEFDRWYRLLRGGQRQVGGLATAVVSVVPAARLHAFEAARAADPAFRRLTGGSGTAIVPAGRRRRYCLVAAGTTRLGAEQLVQEAIHIDWCSSALPGLAGYLRAETDTGRLEVTPRTLGTVFVGAAVYRSGASLGTVAQRRAAVIGWVWSTFDIPAVIGNAIGSRHALSVSLTNAGPGGTMHLLGRVGGSSDDGAFAVRRVLHVGGRWVVAISGPGLPTGLSALGQGLLVLGFGVIVCGLLFALALVLIRSRQRALSLVAERTGELRHHALHDTLTGLPNRELARDRAERMLARARRAHLPAAALFVDLDGFKHVNDTFGHAAGDELLRLVAQRLRSAIREVDTAARLGGDEFVVLMESVELADAPQWAAERLLAVLRRPYRIGEGRASHVTLSASIGIATALSGSAEELLRNADIALYEAKGSGGSRHVVFEPRMQSAIQDRMTLQMDLSEALAREQLHVVFQPIFSLRSGEPEAVEALLRWRHPERGLLMPGQFMEIAEQTGLIVPIGRFVLEDACRRAAAWRRRGHRIGVTVNLSARQLAREAFVDELASALHDSGLAPCALTLEVTETTIMRDAAASARRLRAIKQLGVRIAVDDFGTGYSSLAYLRQFPVDDLKIDRSFVSELSTSKEALALVHTLMQLGQVLELRTIAEGVDEPAQLDVLREEGCDCAQGFLLSPPLEPGALEALFKRGAVPGVGGQRAPAPRAQ